MPRRMTTARCRNGNPLAHRNHERLSPVVASGAGAYAVQASIPLAGLAPGSYVLEVSVMPRDETRESASRWIPIQAK